MSYDFLSLNIYHVCLNIIPFQSTKSFKLCFFKYMYYVLSDYRCQSMDQLFKSLRIHDTLLYYDYASDFYCMYVHICGIFFLFHGSWISWVRHHESYTLMNLLKRHVLF